jgi:hypothetical protein
MRPFARTWSNLYGQITGMGKRMAERWERKSALKSRSLRAEPLEVRQLLSVAPLDNGLSLQGNADAFGVVSQVGPSPVWFVGPEENAGLTAPDSQSGLAAAQTSCLAGASLKSDSESAAPARPRCR